MESLTDKQREFLARRRPLVRSWPIAGGILLVLMIALMVWLFWKNPLLINPFSVLSRIEADALDPVMMTLMAGILPMLMLVCFGLAIALIVFMFTAFANERKYLKIIREISARRASSPGKPAGE